MSVNNTNYMQIKARIHYPKITCIDFVKIRLWDLGIIDYLSKYKRFDCDIHRVP